MPDTLSSPTGVVARTAERLAAGLTPTAEWYTSEAVHELERAHVLRGHWQLVAAASDVAEPGQYVVVPLDEHAEFIVMRGEDGVLRAFANVCPHRGNVLLAGHGSCANVRCGYHGWTFGLDGTLRTGPGLKDLDGFDRSEHGLVEAAVDSWGPFVFLNTDPEAGPLLDFLGDIPTVLGSYGIDLAGVAADAKTRVVTADLHCNWKIAVENALECYHCATVHPGFNATVDLPGWHITLGDTSIVQGTTIRRRDDGTVGARPDEAPAGQLSAGLIGTPGGMDQAMFHWLFPNNSISLWPGPANSFNVARWIPRGPHMTTWWSIRWWPADVDDAVIEDQWEFMSSVGWEDRDIVESVHRGMRSGSWAGGPLVLRDREASCATVRDERGAHRLNTLVAQAILG